MKVLEYAAVKVMPLAFKGRSDFLVCPRLPLNQSVLVHFSKQNPPLMSVIKDNTKLLTVHTSTNVLLVPLSPLGNSDQFC